MTSRPPPPLDSFDETTRPLVQALRSDDPDLRATALAEIADVVNDPLARELLRFAREPHPGRSDDVEERGHALIALGPTLQICWEDEDDDGTLPAPPPDATLFEEAFFTHPLSTAVYEQVRNELRHIYHDADLPKLLRRRALEAAVRAPRDWQRDAAGAAWRSDDPEWRITAIFTMGFLGGLPEDDFDDEIAEAFGSDDPLVRRQAILAAGRAGVERLAGPVMDLAGDRHADREDRLAAIEALGEWMLSDAAELLQDLLGDPDAEIAEAAEWALDEATLLSELDDELDELGDPEGW
ncbi:MAG: HEAT repeat domain-containing protein [Acidobacteriota bacterium]|jgi:hypothetical protein